MGKVGYFFIKLDKEIGVYFSGETITGTLNYQINERLKVNKVKLVASGDAHVHW